MAPSAGAPPSHSGFLDLVAGTRAAVGFTAAAFARALLHPLHDQAQQRGDRPLHVDTSHSARLKIWDPDTR